MRKSKFISLKVLGLIFVLVFAFGSVQAAEFGARAYGMGGAFTGIANELPSMIYNPARLSDSAFQVGVSLGTSDLEEMASFHQFLDDPSEFEESMRLSLVSLSGVSIAGIGAGFAADGTLTVDAGCDAGLCAEGEYMTQILVSMGRQINNPPMNILGLNVGGTIKRLDGRRMQYENTAKTASISDPTYVETMIDERGEGYSLTLGATLALTNMITVGVAASDVFSTLTWTGTETVTNYDIDTDEIVGTKTVTDLDKKTEKLDAVYRAGVSFKPPVFGLTLAADIASDGVLRYGLEKNLLLNLISLRAGQIQADSETTTTFGLGDRKSVV